jgi:hypothetical protein
LDAELFEPWKETVLVYGKFQTLKRLSKVSPPFCHLPPRTYPPENEEAKALSLQELDLLFSLKLHGGIQEPRVCAFWTACPAQQSTYHATVTAYPLKDPWKEEIALCIQLPFGRVDVDNEPPLMCRKPRCLHSI